MKRFTWWRMEQNAPHNARERWGASCSILHHVKRFMSHSPYAKNINKGQRSPNVNKGYILYSSILSEAYGYEAPILSCLSLPAGPEVARRCIGDARRVTPVSSLPAGVGARRPGQAMGSLGADVGPHHQSFPHLPHHLSKRYRS